MAATGCPAVEGRKRCALRYRKLRHPVGEVDRQIGLLQAVKVGRQN